MAGERRRFGLFVLLVFGAIMAARLWNAVLGNVSLIVSGLEVHHFYYGGLLALSAVVFYLLGVGTGTWTFVLFGIGTGLMADEFFFLLLTSGEHAAYFSPVSLYGAVVSGAVVAVLFYRSDSYW